MTHISLDLHHPCHHCPIHTVAPEFEDAPEEVQLFWRTVDSGVTLEDDTGRILEDHVGSINPAPAAGTGPRFLRLNESIWLGKISIGSVMFIRECYPQLWQKIEERKSLRSFGILGEPLCRHCPLRL